MLEPACPGSAELSVTFSGTLPARVIYWQLEIDHGGVFFNPPKLMNGGNELLPLSNGLNLLTSTPLFAY